MTFPMLVLCFSILINSFVITVAQNDFWGQYCGNENYTQNSAYQQNLDDVLFALTGTNNGFGFYNLTSGQANAAALCRGDIEPESCRRCVDDATRRLRQVCPNQVEAAGWYDMCFLKYSNRSMANGNAQSGLINPNNVPNSSFDQWNQRVVNLLGALRSEVVRGGLLRKYASGNISAGSLTVYGMMQCTPDLSETECDNCLARAIDTARPFERRLGIRIYLPDCFIRYESSPFFNSTWFPDPPVPPPTGTKSKFKKHQPRSHCRSNISGGSGIPRGSLLHFPETPETKEKSGYMAPEYAMEGLFSTKSDVYSFGVLLLEIVAGQRNNRFSYQDQPQNFLSTAFRLWKENKGEQLIDKRIIPDFSSNNEALRWINIALLCVQEDPQDRPTMSTVVFMLEGQWTANLPAPSEPPVSFARFAAVVSEQTTTTGDQTEHLSASLKLMLEFSRNKQERIFSHS
ncbi:cysteine-rich receptor-like protein kinase 20 [Artemisia annua]|uniref:Cysteine-rich receptor-like protein kinase 20 n=1 Tax=Artemisia annua TaxID=35608 RepID=A0A2U1KH86_ARTAN|nr:cysteine-rich receptor-like protein kinase 20 [Artemisia annua]